MLEEFVDLKMDKTISRQETPNSLGGGKIMYDNVHDHDDDYDYDDDGDDDDDDDDVEDHIVE